MKRRDVIKAGLAASAAGLLAGQAAAQVAKPNVFARARNIIFFAYDGLSWEDYAAAQFYSRRVLGKTLALERVLSLGVAGLQNVNSLTAAVTESSAASTAWSTGVKTVNGGLAVHIDGRKLMPIFKLAKDLGKAVGVVTTTTVTHATPAGFMINNPDRNAEDQIAEQYLEFGPEVILGGGSRFFDPSVRRDKKDMFAEYAAKGYGVARTTAQLQSSNASKLLGVFSSSHVPYEVDRRFQGVDVPSLGQMVRKALPILSGSRNGFVLQIEAGRIDHAGHANDNAAILWDILAADDALESVISFVDQNPETLLIVGSDHATGVGAVYGAGPSYRTSSAAIDLLSNQKGSIELMLTRLGNQPTAEQVSEMLRTVGGLVPTAAQVSGIVDAITKRVYLPDSVTHSVQPANTVSFLMGNTNYNTPDRPNIGWATGQHTASPVMFALYGNNVGASSAQIGLVENTFMFELMTSALGIRYQNPVMSEQEALEVLRSRAERPLLHPSDSLVLG